MIMACVAACAPLNQRPIPRTLVSRRRGLNPSHPLVLYVTSGKFSDTVSKRARCPADLVVRREVTFISHSAHCAVVRKLRAPVRGPACEYACRCEPGARRHRGGVCGPRGTTRETDARRPRLDVGFAGRSAPGSGRRSGYTSKALSFHLLDDPPRPRPRCGALLLYRADVAVRGRSPSLRAAAQTRRPSGADAAAAAAAAPLAALAAFLCHRVSQRPAAFSLGRRTLTAARSLASTPTIPAIQHLKRPRVSGIRAPHCALA